MVTIEKVIFAGGGGRKKGEESNGERSKIGFALKSLGGKPNEIQARENNEDGANGVNEAKITVDGGDKNKG